MKKQMTRKSPHIDYTNSQKAYVTKAWKFTDWEPQEDRHKNKNMFNKAMIIVNQMWEYRDVQVIVTKGQL